MSEPEYLLTNAGAEMVARFGGLEEAFDALTIEHLARTGLASGWRCLEVGAGEHSAARRNFV